MSEMTANFFREHLKAAVDEVVSNHSVLRVTRRRGGDFVVISADDWDAIAETIHLNQVPGLVESIREAAKEPLERGTNLADLDW
jgi:prevent-host-death family protein